jgi:hypothetical protein
MGVMRAAAAVLAVVLVLASSSCAGDDRFRRAASDSERSNADDRAHAMIEQLGGKAAWDALEVIAFDFVVEAGVEVARNQHLWDKKRGLHRVTLGDQTIYLDLWTRKGHVFEGGSGEPVEVSDPEDKADALKAAYEAFINDTWWLAAPFKVFDDGVNRAVMDGDLRLTFDDGIGLTSGDAYLFHLDAQAMLTGWSFDLESGLKGSFDFSEPVVIEGVTFYSRRSGPMGSGIRLDGLQGWSSAVPDRFAPLKDLRPDAFR